MAVFKYIVINKEGRKLSGTVEAPNQELAREELNHLGFSILTLQKETLTATPSNKGIQFYFEALEQKGKNLTGSIFAATKEEALEKLKGEYFLNVNAIWKSGATALEIEQSREELNQLRQTELQNINENISNQKQIEQKQAREEEFTRQKIDNILVKVRRILRDFDHEFDNTQKALINKKIDKILRIKHSKNTKYILATAQELLQTIEEQEKELKEKGYKEERFKLKLKTKDLLDELKKEQRQKTLSEDIIERIGNWQKKNKVRKENVITKKIDNIFDSIKTKLDTPTHILVQKQKIQYYNRQIFQLIKLYFKEPTPEYKEKVKSSIKALFKARKKTVHVYKQSRKLHRESLRKNYRKENRSLLFNLTVELNNFSGWLLSLYIIYYFTAIYLTTKAFNITNIPQGFRIYESNIFKFALVIIFIFHSLTALKVNFFPSNKIVNFVFPIFFLFSSLIVILNF